MTTARASAEQSKALSLFTLIADTPAVFPHWQQLVVRHDVKGRSAHDARLVAAMTVHGIGQLLTFNGPDFVRYPGISVLSPESFLPNATPP